MNTKVYSIKYFNKHLGSHVEKNIVAVDEQAAYTMIDNECPKDLRLKRLGDSLEDSLVIYEVYGY